MSYVALYRTYRPKTFSEVYGQKVVVQTLQNALKNNKFGHAYIFSGPRGTGKTSIAKIVAKALNCEKAPIADPCCECAVCRGIDKGDVPDIIEIDAASNNGVDEIRDLRDKVKYAPSVGKYKVYIIDEVHMLTNAAFNALLKTLEEPPKYVVFILATTEIHKVPATILSRCQRFDFKNIDSIDIENNIKKIALQENLKISDDAVHAIAQTSEGGMRDALSLLDQVVSFSESEISEDDVYKVSGGLSKGFITELLNYIHTSQPQKALDFLNRVLGEGKDITRMVSDLILALRDILLDKIKDESKYPDLKHLTTQMIYAYLDILNNLQQDLKFTTTKRAYLELAVLKMINHETINLVDLETKIDNLRQHIRTLEDKLQTKTVEVVKETKAVVKEKKEAKKPLVTVKEIEEILNNGDREKRALLKKGWDSLKDYDQPLLKSIAELLSEGSLEAVGNNKMLIVYDDYISAHTMLKKDVKEKVLQIINNKSKLINDYTVLLRPDWIQLKNDYAEQYNVGTTKPKLKQIDLHLYEVKEGEVIEETYVDPLVEFAEEYFGKEIVKVEE